MLIPVLWVCGAFLAGYGGWRGYKAARAALRPATNRPDRLPQDRRIVHLDASLAGEEVARRLHAIGRDDRSPWRRFAVGTALAVGWLAVAMWGMLMLNVASRAG